MNIKAFLVDALTAALDLELGTPDDVLRHVTPDVLAHHLPRPLWARLLTACLGAPRVDARLVVETIGIANLCEHIPSTILWSCIAEIGERSLGKAPEAPAATMQMTASGRSIIPPPPEASSPTGTPANATPVAVGPSIPPPTPIGDVIADLEQTDEARVSRPRAAPSQRFRQSSTSAGRGLASSRRPQAMATPSPPAPLPRVTSGSRRAPTEVTVDEPETHVSDWGGKEIAVDDSQLVDWQTDVGTANAIVGDDDFSDLGSRKR